VVVSGTKRTAVAALATVETVRARNREVGMMMWSRSLNIGGKCYCSYKKSQLSCVAPKTILCSAILKKPIRLTDTFPNPVEQFLGVSFLYL
jgi:hypothetical protein